MAAAVFDLERAARMVAAYTEGPGGTTFADVGKLFGISGERVRQVVEKYEEVTGTTVPRRAKIRPASAAVAPAPPKPSLAQQLLGRAKLAKSGCWEWTGPTSLAGAPVFTRLKGQQHAHRAAFVLWCGPIPARTYVAQTCRNRVCINPAHLIALPRKEAIRLHPNWDAERDTWRTGRERLTHCRNGHEFTVENTRWVTHGMAAPGGGTMAVTTRLCAVCARQRGRRHAGTHPRPGKPLPPLPADLPERELEQQIRAIVRVTPASARAPELWREVEARIGHTGLQATSTLVRVLVRFAALPNETWATYATRTGGHGEYEEWFVARMLADPRIQKVLSRAGSVFIISDQWPGGTMNTPTIAPRDDGSDTDLLQRWLGEVDEGETFIEIYGRYRDDVRKVLEDAGLPPMGAENRVGSVFAHAEHTRHSLPPETPLRERLVSAARTVAAVPHQSIEPCEIEATGGR